MHRAVAWILLGLLPAVAAAPNAYEHEGDLPTAVTSPLVSSHHVFTIPAAAGQDLDAVLRWSDPTADLDLWIWAPSSLCRADLTECATQVLPRDLRCEGIHARGARVLAPSPENVSWTLPETGTYLLEVEASLAPPLTTVAYRLTLQLDDAAPTSVEEPPQDGPARLNPNLTPHCRVQRVG